MNRVDDLPARPGRRLVEPVAEREDGLDETVVDRVHQHGGREPGEGEEHLARAARRPHRRAEPGPERRRPEWVVEHGRPEEVAAVEEDVEAALQSLVLGRIDEIEDVLGEREAEPDRGAVDDPARDPFEDGQAEALAEPADRADRRQQRKPLRGLLDERRRDRVPEDVARGVGEHRPHDPIAGEGDQRRAGRAPADHHRQQPERLAPVGVGQPDQQQDDDRLDDGVADVEARVVQDLGHRLQGRKHRYGPIDKVTVGPGLASVTGPAIRVARSGIEEDGDRRSARNSADSARPVAESRLSTSNVMPVTRHPGWVISDRASARVALAS